jgi:hypothetical protein
MGYIRQIFSYMEEAICLISKTGCKDMKRERLAEMKENILTQGNEA